MVSESLPVVLAVSFSPSEAISVSYREVISTKEIV